MHQVLLSGELFKAICEELIKFDGGLGCIAALARTHMDLEEEPLDLLWGKRQIELVEVLQALPPDSWVYTDPLAEVPTFVRFYHFLSYGPGKC